MGQTYVTVEQLARQCNIDNLTSDDKIYLSDLLDASVQAIENRIQQPIDDVVDSSGHTPVSLRQAILLLAANLYANREPVAYGTPQKIPYTFDYLISSYIKRY